MPRRLACLLLALPTLGCAAPGPASSPGAVGEQVTFRFAWPAEFVARVEARVARQQGRSVRYAFELRTEAEGDLLWLRHDAFRVAPPSRPGEFVALSPGSEAAAMIAGLQPDLLVDRAGTLRDVDDAGAGALVDEALAKDLFEGSGHQLEQARQLLARAAKGQLAARAQEIWYALVEFWTGHTYELGASYELEIQQGAEGRPELQEDFVADLEVSGWIPCPTGGPERRCVELTLHSRLAEPDPTQIARGIAEGARELGLGELPPDVLHLLANGADVIREYDRLEEIRLVCEPRGLIPHELDHRQELRIEIQVPGEGSERGGRVRETAYRFDYDG